MNASKNSDRHIEILKKWFLKSFPSAPGQNNNLSILGSKPVDKKIFGNLLRSAGLKVSNINNETNILIVGREGWDENILNVLLDNREGKELKVYSQEMFLAYWVSRKDPFGEAEVARAFGVGHPALEHLSSLWFAWPSTIVRLSRRTGVLAELPPGGILGAMGYNVRKNGPSVVARRRILIAAFTTKLIWMNSDDYMQEWGRANSKERLKKMAVSLAQFCRNQKMKENRKGVLSYGSAVVNWEKDLEWLRQKYYKGRFKFQWPKTFVKI